MHVRIRQDLPDNQDIFAFPEERQKAQSLSLGEGPLLRYSESGKGGIDNKQNPLNPACPVECEAYSSGVNPVWQKELQICPSGPHALVRRRRFIPLPRRVLCHP